MEQPCYKCGQLVEVGRPFCLHCAAPQIRVVIAEPVAVPVLAEAAASSDGTTALPASQTLPVLALPMQWSQALKPCALAALVASLLMSLGLNPFVAMVSVGFLAVVLYRQRQPGAALRPLMGARLGALSGLLWFAVSSILETVIVLTMHKGPELQKALTEVIEQATSRTSDPQALEMLQRFKTPDGLEFLMVAGIICAFVAAIVLSAIGGAVAGMILGRRK
jgi:hypothetical protein